MSTMKYAELLKNPVIIATINEYKWIESEKNGYDIGFERASSEWLDKHAEGWMKKNQVKKVSAKTMAKPVVKVEKASATKLKKTARR